MLRSQLEHVLRACGSIVDEDVLIVIGSQAILGSLADPPAELTAISKLADGRKKDLAYVQALKAHGIVTKSSLAALLDELAPERRALVEPRVAGMD